MSKMTPEQAEVIAGITGLAQELYATLDGGQSREQILSAQQDLTAAAELVWARAEGDASISSQDRAIVRLLTGAALKELPEMIQDPANYDRIKKQLRLLKSSLVLLE